MHTTGQYLAIKRNVVMASQNMFSQTSHKVYDSNLMNCS